MPSIPDSQGSEVFFDGQRIGRLTRFAVDFPAVTSRDVTSFSSAVIGSGWNARVYRQLNITSVPPPVATITFLGSGFSDSDRGRVATLAIAFAGGGVSGAACLSDFRIEGSVGELLQTSATFQFTGF